MKKSKLVTQVEEKNNSKTQKKLEKNYTEEEKKNEIKTIFK